MVTVNVAEVAPEEGSSSDNLPQDAVDDNRSPEGNQNNDNSNESTPAPEPKGKEPAETKEAEVKDPRVVQSTDNLTSVLVSSQPSLQNSQPVEYKNK